MMQDSVRAIAEPGSTLYFNVDGGLARRFLTIWWASSVVTGAAVIGLVAVCFFIYATINHVAVLQYDLMDLRAKTGFAHENTPEPEAEE